MVSWCTRSTPFWDRPRSSTLRFRCCTSPTRSRLVRSNQKLDSASQVVDLPEHTVGPASLRRTILKKSGKGSPREYLEVKFSKTAARFIKIQEQLGPSFGSHPGWTQTHHRNPTRLRLRQRQSNNTLWAEDDAKKQHGNGPRSCTKFVERSWRTMLHSSNQSWSGQHQLQPSIQTKENLLLILVHLCI